MLEIRKFRKEDASTILSWCDSEEVFRKWSADRYKRYPVTVEDMMEQYDNVNIHPLCLLDDHKLIGHLFYDLRIKEICVLGLLS